MIVVACVERTMIMLKKSLRIEWKIIDELLFGYLHKKNLFDGVYNEIII